VQTDLGGNGKPVVWVSPELEAAVMHLEKVKGEENVIAAIHKCKLLYCEFALYVTQITQLAL